MKNEYYKVINKAEHNDTYSLHIENIINIDKQFIIIVNKDIYDDVELDQKIFIEDDE